MVRTSYIVSGRDLRVRKRNRPEPGEPTDPEEPGNGGDGGDGGEDGNGELPTDPGPGAAVRVLPVVKVIALPEGAELPTHPPHTHGKLCIVAVGRRKKALGWLEKEHDLPSPEPEGPQIQPGRPTPQPRAEDEDENGETPTIPGAPAGHWLPVREVLAKQPRAADEHEFAFVFEINADFGQTSRPQPLPQPITPGGTRPQPTPQPKR